MKELEAEYRKLLEEARREYEYEPPTWYKDGYNLYRRLAADPASYLLFLHDPAVPTTNNLAERLLRDCKRKQKQAVTFRSFESMNSNYIGTASAQIFHGILFALWADGRIKAENIEKT